LKKEKKETLFLTNLHLESFVYFSPGLRLRAVKIFYCSVGSLDDEAGMQLLLELYLCILQRPPTTVV